MTDKYRKELLTLLQNFNYNSVADKEKLNELIPHLSGLKIVQYKISKGMSVYRARRHEVRDKFSCECQISYRRDRENITSLGRCNLKHLSKFYGAVTSTEIPHGWMPAIIETSKLCRDDNDGYELYSIGKWVANKDLHFYVIKPPESTKNDSILNRELYDLYESKRPSSVENELFECFGLEFSKKVPTGQNEQYYLSANITESILRGSQIGILYPSVQSESKSYNLVMNPEKFDEHFDIDKVMVSELFKVQKRVHVRNTDVCMDAKIQPFQFDRVPENEYPPDSCIKEYFLREGISKNEIDWLFNQRKEFLKKS